VYAYARPRLLQIRTLVTSAQRQATIGSGFLVGPDGLAVTNYHVVSQFALEPQTYTLEYQAPDGSTGPLKLLAFDVIHDLAVVKLDGGDHPYLEFEARAIDGSLPKGERLYAMGNPLDLGFTIVEGTYNGLVERSYNEQVHFSGALNAGMSGGPTTTGDGRVAGVNVAVSLQGQLVSFLVPARYAAMLVNRAELGRQLYAWQARFYKDLGDIGFKAMTFGPWRAPESAAPWFQCWASTNADAIPKPRARDSTTQCVAQTSIFIAGNLRTGAVQYSHAHLKSIDLNAFQFAALVSQRYKSIRARPFDRKRLTRLECLDEYLESPVGSRRPPLQVRWCARAYRDFEGLYDVSVVAATQDAPLEALVSQLSMQGVSWDSATAFTRRFLGEMQWAK
jgi:serine protease Do